MIVKIAGMQMHTDSYLAEPARVVLLCEHIPPGTLPAVTIH